MARLAQQYARLLDEALRDPAQPLWTLPLGGAASLSPPLQIQTTRHPATLVAAFEARGLLAQPDATALVWETQQLSYGELDRRANSLARWLRNQGVRAEDRVGVLVPRSPERR